MNINKKLIITGSRHHTTHKYQYFQIQQILTNLINRYTQGGSTTHRNINQFPLTNQKQEYSSMLMILRFTRIIWMKAHSLMMKWKLQERLL